MTTATFECPPELMTALGKRPAEAIKEVQLMAALKLFDMGRISSGLAAKMAGISRADFLLECGKYGVSIFQQTPEELESDVETAIDARNR